MKVVFDFSTLKCKIDGEFLSNEAKTLQIVGSAEDGLAQALALFEEHKDKCVDYLHGSFAFCVYDNQTKEVFAVRDHIGIQNLYFAQLPTAIVFSDTLREIVPLVYKPIINIEELVRPIRHNYPIDLRHTWIEQINRVLAGEWLKVSRIGIDKQIYYTRKHENVFAGTKQEASDMALSILRKSIKRYKERCKKPIAVMLSGGVDSTSLASLLREIDTEVHAFCICYKDKQGTVWDERDRAHRFADEKRLIYHELELDVDDFEAIRDEMSLVLDESTYDFACFAQYVAFKKIADMGYGAILSGLGGDEQFYSYAGVHEMVEAYQKRKKWVALSSLGLRSMKYWKYVLKNYKELLSPRKARVLTDYEPDGWMYDYYVKFAKEGYLNLPERRIRLRDVDVAYHIPDEVTIQSMYEFIFATSVTTRSLYTTVSIGKAAGLEILCPLLDVEFVNFIDTLPMEMKYDGFELKKFQKDMMAGILPDYILHAKKNGSAPPFDFLEQMSERYQYKYFESNHTYYNSMMADILVNNYMNQWVRVNESNKD